MFRGSFEMIHKGLYKGSMRVVEGALGLGFGVLGPGVHLKG